MAMTAAERSRRYRDGKRGSQPQGRWAGHTPVALIAASMHVGRTTVFRASWLRRNAPEYIAAIEAGRIKVGTAYRLARAAEERRAWEYAQAAEGAR